jgi:enoyl-[acyl-carrier protein] reductase II
MLTLGEIAAAVSNSGGFGQIAASGLSLDRLLEEVKKARGLTNQPFGINIPLHRPNASEALEIAIEMGIKTVTTSGADPAKVMERIKEAGLKVLHKVSTVKMALKAKAAGVDGIIATGYEAGGHIGREDVTTFCLIPELVNILKIPIVAAGGVADARGLLAALALGAEGVEVGTRFLATRECPIPDFFKQLILEARCESTIVLGRKKAMPLRVLRNKAAESMGETQEGEVFNNVADRTYVQSCREQDSALLPCGQAAGLCEEIKSIEEVFPEMMKGARLLSFRLYSLLKGGE